MTQHTAFERADNTEPAAVTALAVSKYDYHDNDNDNYHDNDNANYHVSHDNDNDHLNDSNAFDGYDVFCSETTGRYLLETNVAESSAGWSEQSQVTFELKD